MFHTSSGCQCGKLIFSDGEASIVVGGDPEVVPGGGVQVEDHKVAAGLDVVGDHAPVLLVLGFVLHHEVDDGTAAVLPGVEVESDAPGRDLQEPAGVRDGGLHPLGLGGHHGGRLAQADTENIIMMRPDPTTDCQTHSL